MDEQQIRELIGSGLSMSKVAKQLNKSVGSISTFCKRHGIISSYKATPLKQLPIEEIYARYTSGISLDALRKAYNAPIARIKKQLVKRYPNIRFRSMDEAKRPSTLNDAILLSKLLENHSQREIARKLHVKPGTVGCAIRRLGLTECLRTTIQHISTDEFVQLYQSGLSLTQIADAYGTYPTSVLSRLNSAGIVIRSAGGRPRESKYALLNDKEWLHKAYIEQERSMGQIAAEIGTSLRNIAYYIAKYNIPKRPRNKAVELMLKRDWTPKAKANIISTIWGNFKLKSAGEIAFVKKLSADVKSVIYEPECLEDHGSMYIPDFMVDNKYVEIKPKTWAVHSGVDRRKFVSQWQTAIANNKHLLVWDGNYLSPEPISDIDKYYAINWRQFFDSPDELATFLLRIGWIPPETSKDTLLHSMLGWMVVPTPQRLNANFPKAKAVAFMRHFHRGHYYRSKHSGYSSIEDAFDVHNSVVIRRAVGELWSRSKSCNIYGLIEYITRHFRNFSMPSLFKPWVAREVYARLLPGGGKIVDPCMGWGGRMLACMQSEYEYIGSDLNPLSVEANKQMAKFARGQYVVEPRFSVLDATCHIEDGDLLFTSPPYDDTERYHGLLEQCTDTTPIYRKIFSCFSGIVALNIPKRHVDKVSAIANEFKFKQVDMIEMRTADFGGHKKTFEPILVFKRA